MSTKLRLASGIAVAAMFVSTLVSVNGSGALAQTRSAPISSAQISSVEAPGTLAANSQNFEPRESQVTFVTAPVVQPIAETTPDISPAIVPLAADAATAGSLHSLVADTPLPESLSGELSCLAGAIYFEAKGESLAGQLAVGKVIIARAKSGRFPASYCGVVYQPSQFSFVRGRTMPTINKSGRAWAEAAKIAQIAHFDAWDSPVEGALFFHAARVSPGWRLTRMARVDNHVFYR